MVDVIETAVPGDSVLQAALADADFHDAYMAPLIDATLSPKEIFLRVSRMTPAWVGMAMSLRNRFVRLLGLKAVGGTSGQSSKPADSYKVGDRLGIFTMIGCTENELLLGIDDLHLDVRVSVLKVRHNGSGRYVVSTVVHVHNWLGHAYMVPVGRIHPLIVKAMLRRCEV